MVHCCCFFFTWHTYIITCTCIYNVHVHVHVHECITNPTSLSLSPSPSPLPTPSLHPLLLTPSPHPPLSPLPPFPLQVATTPGCPHEFLTCEERGMVRIYDLRTCSSCLCDGDCTRVSPLDCRAHELFIILCSPLDVCICCSLFLSLSLVHVHVHCTCTHYISHWYMHMYTVHVQLVERSVYIRV